MHGPPPCMPTRTVLHCTCFVLRSTGIPDRTRPPRRRHTVQPRAECRQSTHPSNHGLAIQPVPRVRGSPLARLLPACHWPSWSMGREYHGSTTPYPPARQPGAVVYNATQWTTSRLPLWPGQHVVLSNRFRLQNFVFFYYYRHNGIRDVSRVKDGASAYGIVFVKFIPWLEGFWIDNWHLHKSRHPFIPLPCRIYFFDHVLLQVSLQRCLFPFSSL